MADIVIRSNELVAARQAPPAPKGNIAIRPAVMEDVAFIDGLQKLQSKQVGWMPTATLVGKVRT
ncbi:MAG TPA: hypothetical protein VGN72_22110 [Tepidisphaeraceae bacterium]|jgi:hypothetical protein|nr:hypothetical protein [Tepidisphaeraceae bacterium]